MWNREKKALKILMLTRNLSQSINPMKAIFVPKRTIYSKKLGSLCDRAVYSSRTAQRRTCQHLASPVVDCFWSCCICIMVMFSPKLLQRGSKIWVLFNALIVAPNYSSCSWENKNSWWLSDLPISRLWNQYSSMASGSFCKEGHLISFGWKQ